MAGRNRLARETSPYLLQHADNPVDWYPWGSEAFETARGEGKAVLLSVGYSACHWCHVMAHESFEDEATARVMNENFVCVKVDREERPDVDDIYMNCVQMITGRGGWPMTVFLTPEGEPFYGGTYFPPDDRHGLPSFQKVLLAVAEAYRTRPNDVRATAEKLLEGLRKLDRSAASVKPLDGALVAEAAGRLSAAYDNDHGGLGRAPKFPNTMAMSLFLRAFHRSGRRQYLDIATHTLRRMADGGIYDHLGGGFHRYSVDDRWLVPHFEKMLYDNAQLAPLYFDAHRASGDGFFRAIGEDILRYVTREMLAPEGGFYSTQDADSEGEEGKFFVWEKAEVVRLLGEGTGEIFCRVYDVTEGGNFEGRNILHATLSPEQAARMFRKDPAEMEKLLSAARAKLFAARELRRKPFRDEKILTAWNGLALSAYADAYRLTGNAEYREVAERTVRFIEARLWSGGRLLHAFKDGEARIPAFLDDYAALGVAYLDLFDATFDAAHLGRAEAIARRLAEDFWDESGGGFFFTAKDHERLITRTKPAYDGSVPSGNSLAADLNLRLHHLTGDSSSLEKAERVLRLYRDAMEDNPFAHARSLAVLDDYAHGAPEVVIVAPGGARGAAALLDPLRRRYQPSLRIFAYDPASPPASVPPFAREKPLLGGKATAYVCRGSTCSPPATDWEGLCARLQEPA
jgi:hypothetical protein